MKSTTVDPSNFAVRLRGCICFISRLVTTSQWDHLWKENMDLFPPGNGWTEREKKPACENTGVLDLEHFHQSAWEISLPRWKFLVVPWSAVGMLDTCGKLNFDVSFQSWFQWALETFNISFLKKRSHHTQANYITQVSPSQTPTRRSGTSPKTSTKAICIDAPPKSKAP